MLVKTYPLAVIQSRNYLFFLLIVLSFNAVAQKIADTVDRRYDLEQIVVSAERVPMVYSKLMRIVQVISRSEIESLPAQSLDQILEYVVNVDSRNRGSYGVQTDVSIRGGCVDQTLILLNGINISDPQTGHHSMDLPVDLSNVERIEILEGPGSRIFGPNAFSGAINIITGSDARNKLQTSASGGQYGTYKVSVRASVKQQNAQNELTMSYSSSDGYVENTDFRMLNLFYHGKLLSKPALDFQAGYTGKAFGANSFYTPKYPNQYETTRTIFTSLKAAIPYLKIEPQFYWRRHYDKFELFRNDPPSWYTNHNYHCTDVVGSGLNHLIAEGTHTRTIIGYDLRFERIVSNKLGDSLKDPLVIPGTDLKYTLGKGRYFASLFAEQAFINDRWSLSAGLSANYFSNPVNAFNFYPGIDIGYNLTSHLRWYATVNRTLRLPTFTDLFYNDPSNVGDPGLKPEEAFVVETGLKWNQPGLSAHVAAFKRFGKNMIDWVHPENELIWHAANIGNINISGAEFFISCKFYELFNTNTIIRRITLGYSYLQADQSSGNYISKYVFDFLKHKADIQVDHSIWKKLSACWCLSLQDREGKYLKFENGSFDQQWTDYKPALLLDGRISWSSETVVLYIDGTNLLNVKVVDFSNVPQPGRWISGGVKWTLSR